jgi:hypothetical protein
MTICEYPLKLQISSWIKAMGKEATETILKNEWDKLVNISEAIHAETEDRSEDNDESERRDTYGPDAHGLRQPRCNRTGLCSYM